MSTGLEDRLRGVLREMAEDAQPVPLLERLDARDAARTARWPAVSWRPSGRVVLAAVAAVLVVLVAVGALVVRASRPAYVGPVDRPPHVLQLTGRVSSAPGPARLMVIVAPPADVAHPAHLLGADGRVAELTQSAAVPQPFTQQISRDGRYLVRQNSVGGANWIEVVDLRTGEINGLGGLQGYCPNLSPDGSTVMFVDDEHLQLVDVRTGRRLPTTPIRIDFSCPRIGWSPDGRLIGLETERGSALVDRDGRVVERLGDRVLAASDMSWSPDARSVLLYDVSSGGFYVHRVGGGDVPAVPPVDGARARGWAGDRVVWLVGEAGDERLVTALPDGTDSRTWMRLDVGDQPVETVQWSWDLSGRPR